MVKGYHAEDREEKVFSLGVMRLLDNVTRSLTATSIMGLSASVLLGVVGAVIMFVGAKQILAGALTMGGFFTYTLFMGFLIAPIMQIVQIGTQITEALAGLERTHEILIEPAEDSDPRRTVTLPAIQGNIDFEAVSFSYDGARTVLNDVSFHAAPGTVTALVGSSGSGKSTLFHIIGGLTPATGGTVRIGGQDISSLTDAGRTALRKNKVGFVFQKFNLLPNLTAADNIAIARYIAGSALAPEPEFEEVLKLLGISERLNHRPAALSGGEQQRVAIARAIVNHPAILLADEPTGNLDSENSAAVLDVMRDLNRRLGQTILMITHNPEAAAFAHRTVRMRDGRIVG